MIYKNIEESIADIKSSETLRSLGALSFLHLQPLSFHNCLTHTDSVLC